MQLSIDRRHLLLLYLLQLLHCCSCARQSRRQFHSQIYIGGALSSDGPIAQHRRWATLIEALTSILIAGRLSNADVL